MNSRKARLPEIIDILAHQVISSQEELSKQLAIRGHIITQATLSRDLKLLKANKVSDDRGGYRYVIGENHPFLRGRKAQRPQYHGNQGHTAALSISITGNLIVIKHATDMHRASLRHRRIRIGMGARNDSRSRHSVRRRQRKRSARRPLRPVQQLPARPRHERGKK